MALCTNNCNPNEMVSHDYNECLPVFKGNSYSVAYILCDEANDDLKVNYTASGAWNTILSGANPNDDLVIVNGVVVNMTSEIVTTDNPYKNGEDTTKDGESFTFTVTDPNVSPDNFDFYNAIDKRLVYVAIAFNDGRMWVSEEKIRLHKKTPQIVNAESQSFTLEGQRTFENGKGWLPFLTQPAGIFTY